MKSKPLGEHMKKKILLSCLVASSIVLACQVIDGNEFDIYLGTINPAKIGDYGDEIERQLGEEYGTNVQVTGVVRYSARIPILGIRGGLHSIPLTKHCDQTFKERWQEIYSPMPPPSYGGGGTIFFPGFPNIPGGCVGNCSGTVTVGDVQQT